MRVVSLACSNTEIICALGAADELVAVDDHSDFPADVVARLPRVGPDLSVDVDKIASLRPDLVVASLTVPGHERNIAALEARGLPFIAPEPRCLDDVYADIRLIGQALGRAPRAEELVTRMQLELAPLEPGPAAPKVLVEWVAEAGDLARTAELGYRFATHRRGANPLSERDVKSTPLSDEEVAELAPDAFVISWCGVRPEKYRPEVVLRRPAWQVFPAIKRGHVFCVPEAYLGRPGPRLVEGYRALRQIVEQVVDARR